MFGVILKSIMRSVFESIRLLAYGILILEVENIEAPFKGVLSS